MSAEYSSVPGNGRDPALAAGYPRLAYLTSRYPATSHTFIYREIQALRRLGASVETSSINIPDRPMNQLSDTERREAASVFYIKATPMPRILAAHVRTLIRRPRGFWQGLKLVCRHSAANYKYVLKWVGYFAEAIIVGDRMKQRGYNHLHVHFATEVANAGYLAAAIFGFEFSMTVHGPDEFYDVSHYLLNRKIEAARLVCCISSFSRSQLMKVTSSDQWHKLHVAPLGVDVTEFAPQPFRPSPETFELLCVGRLVPAKGQHILLRAVGALRARGYRVHLRLAGDGPDRKSLEDYCAACDLGSVVTFEGAVNQDRVHQLMTTADAFVLASFAEGVPVVLMEAMASEVACIATRITGIPELIRDGVDGLLVPPSDEEALAGVIAAVIDDPALRRRIGTGGRIRVADRFEIERNVTRLRDLFCEHLQAHRLTPGDSGQAAHRPDQYSFASVQHNS